MERDETRTPSPTNKEEMSVDQITLVREGKCSIQLKPSLSTFYNPAQEVNRDISVLGIETYLRNTPSGKKGKPESVTILEAMAASGIRSIRYAKEITGLSKVIANDMSKSSFGVIEENCRANETGSLVEPHLSEACALMYSQEDAHFVVDIDPYGTPIPFLDSAIKCVKNGGMLLVTATDLAILAGNAAETCYAKYGSMSLKSEACHEMALRILIHAVQAIANRYGRFVEPLLSLKIDFYIRIFFRVRKSPLMCKTSASKTSMVFQCVGCRSLAFQPLGLVRENGKYGFAHGPTVSEKCEHCRSNQNIGGPIWTGTIHEKSFVKSMLEQLLATHSYLGTQDRIEGLLNLVLEEIESPLYYRADQLCSFLKSPPIPLLKVRSALINLGYEVSNSHTGPNTLKTNAPNSVLWDVIRAWAFERNPVPESSLPDPSPARILLSKPRDTWTSNIKFDVREDANPPSRETRVLRYQQNRNKNFGPGIRSKFNVSSLLEKRLRNQNRRKNIKLKLSKS